MPKITVRLNTSSIDKAIEQLKRYQKKLEKAGDEIAKRLAQRGYDVAYTVMQGHVFSGETINSLAVEQIEEGKYVLKAASKALLFFEFGAGVNGGGHPDPHGYGPGTYPGKGHWDDPNGWWFETDDPRLIIRQGKNGKGYGHSYGNPPRMPFYLADKEIKDNILNVAKEVMADD